MDDDPISQFFPNQEDVDLYAVLDLKSDASAEAIKKAYRRAALLHHPDKHANASDDHRQMESVIFQQVGFAYAVLSDDKRRTYYNATGKTTEGAGLDVGEDGWEAYFEQLFDRVNRDKLDDMKREYQGSAEEQEDIKAAYISSKGSIEEIMRQIMHSTYEDEARFIVLIDGFISTGVLKSTKTWARNSKDEKAKLVREKQGKKEAAEAEVLAKELGVWDEFYGTGKEGTRRGKGKAAVKGRGNAGKSTQNEQDEEVEDTTALQALILGRKKNMDGFFDSLAAKYAEPEPRSKGKRKKGDVEEEGGPSKKSRSRTANMPDIPDDEFERLQQNLFADKDTSAGKSKSRSRKRT